MPKVTYVEFDGTARVVEVAAGASVMKGAVRNNVPGIDAECGGQMSCATCHVFVDEEWVAKVGQPSDSEQVMLEFADGATDRSRLGCQITVTEDLDGLVVATPESQG